jgi:hypothetical protein
MIVSIDNVEIIKTPRDSNAGLLAVIDTEPMLREG